MPVPKKIPAELPAIKAVNSKHQRMVDRCVRLNSRYDELVDAGQDETIRCMNVWDKLMECLTSLPKREQKNLVSKTTIVI